MLGSTILKVLLILIANWNCVQKSLGLIWPFLEITSLKLYSSDGKVFLIEIRQNQLQKNVLKMIANIVCKMIT